MHDTIMPVTLATAAVTILTALFCAWTGFNVGRMRGKHNVKAPAMTGHLEFESAVRVQMNTLEWVVVFLPLLWLATIYFSPSMTMVYLSWLPPVLGLIWVIGRVLYMSGYMRAPDQRSTGFLIALVCTVGLLICSIIGITMTWSAVSAT